ncbi:MAG TPA: hypothetical protein VGA00_06915 [Acidiferrobacterales bacterium]
MERNITPTAAGGNPATTSGDENNKAGETPALSSAVSSGPAGLARAPDGAR